MHVRARSPSLPSRSRLLPPRASTGCCLSWSRLSWR